MYDMNGIGHCLACQYTPLAPMARLRCVNIWPISAIGGVSVGEQDIVRFRSFHKDVLFYTNADVGPSYSLKGAPKLVCRYYYVASCITNLIDVWYVSASTQSWKVLLSAPLKL